MRVLLCLPCRSVVLIVPGSERILHCRSRQCVYRIHKAVSPDLHEVVQSVDPFSSAVPVPVILCRDIDQTVVFFMPVVGSVTLQYAAFVPFQIGKQIRLPRLPDLLLGYAGHGVLAALLFIQRTSFLKFMYFNALRR